MPTAYSLIPLEKPLTEDETVELYAPVVSYYAARVILTTLRSYEDIMQDGFIGVVQAYRRWDESKSNGGTFRSWAVGIIRQWIFYEGSRLFGLDNRECSHWNEKLAVVFPSISIDADQEEHGDFSSLLAHLDPPPFIGVSFESLTARLSGKDKTCMYEYYVEDRTLKEIGQGLGVSRQAVQQRLTKAHKEIKESLRSSGIDAYSDL